MRRMLIWLAILLLVAPTRAGDKAPTKAVVVARVFSSFDTIWSVPEKDSPPKPLELFSLVTGSSRLITPPGQRGVLEAREGDVRVTLIGNLPEFSSSPALETVVRLQASAELDLDLLLERGLVLVELGKDVDAVKLRFRVKDKHFDMMVQGKNGAVALELTGRWPAEAELFCYLLRGKAVTTLAPGRFPIEAPAMIRSTKESAGWVALKKAPDWLYPERISGKDALAVMKASEAIRRRLEKQPNAWAEALTSKDAIERQTAVYRAVAFGQIKETLAALNADEARSVRRAAIIGLRHWIGHGGDADVYNSILGKLKTEHGKRFTKMLQGFDGLDAKKPETYETLIADLQHDVMGMRELAAEQLALLVPAGKEIAYDAAAPADVRAASQAAWRKLIPKGMLPK